MSLLINLACFITGGIAGVALMAVLAAGRRNDDGQ